MQRGYPTPNTPLSNVLPDKPTGPRPPLWPVQTPPAPARGPLVTGFANDNFAPVNSTRLGLRTFGRVVPYIGIILTAWELYDMLNGMDNPYGFVYSGPWYKVDTCGAQLQQLGPPMIQVGHTTQCATQQNNSGQFPWGVPVTNSWNKITRMNQHRVDLIKYQAVEHWQRDSTSSTDQVPEVPGVLSLGPPAVPAFPMVGDPLVPQAVPDPLPYSQVPDIPNTPWRDTGPEPIPETVQVLHPGPPGPGVTERKVRTPYPVIINIVTEGMDAVDAVWWALPVEYRTPDANPVQQIADILTGYQHIDVPTAIENLLWNEFQDQMIGRINSLFPNGPPLGLQSALADIMDIIDGTKQYQEQDVQEILDEIESYFSDDNA